MKKIISAVLVLTMMLALLSGCTEAERRGYSSIPHNTPASWEINPYGDSFHN